MAQQTKKQATREQEQKSAPLTEAERIRRLKSLKSGQKFCYKNIGFGLTSYEDGSEKVWRKSGKLFTPTFDSMGMEWNGKTWEFDGGLGMKTLIVLPEDVPPGQISA